MQVKDVMTESFEMVDASNSITDVARKMKTLNVGALPVREGNNLIGMVTDRDIILRVLAESKDATQVSVKEIMSPGIFHCSSDSDIEEACRIMKEQQVRRLLVLDNENAPMGIISLGDIAAKSHAEKLSGETLKSVSQPSHPARESS